MRDIIELKECSERLDNFGGDKSLDRVHIHLCLRNVSRARDYLNIEPVHLHQTLRVIAGPLAKILALFEPS